MRDEIAHSESDFRFQAMLYVLSDSALDRDMFEQRLAENPELCEFVAEAVEASILLKQAMSSGLNASSEQGTSASGVLAQRAMAEVLTASSVELASCVASGALLGEAPNTLTTPGRRSSSWFGLLMVAASIVLVGFIGWRIQDRHSKMLGSIAKTDATVRSTELADVANAWTDIQSDSGEDLSAVTSDVNINESELSLDSSKDPSDREVPDWLITALGVASRVPSDGAVQ